MRSVLLVLSFALLSGQAQVTLPDGDGKALVQRVCAGCHGLETAVDSTRTEVDWRRVVDSMAGRGAQGTDAEFKLIVAYLAKNFGKGPAAVPAAAAKEGATAKAGGADYLAQSGSEKRLAPISGAMARPNAIRRWRRSTRAMSES